MSFTTSFQVKSPCMNVAAQAINPGMTSFMSHCLAATFSSLFTQPTSLTFLFPTSLWVAPDRINQLIAYELLVSSCTHHKIKINNSLQEHMRTLKSGGDCLSP